MTTQPLANAIWALNAILVAGRMLAYEKASHEDLAEVLDAAELLPILLLKDDDETDLFRGILEDLARKFPSMHQALDRFEGRGEVFVQA